MDLKADLNSKFQSLNTVYRSWDKIKDENRFFLIMFRNSHLSHQIFE